MDYVFKRSEFKRPPAQLEHVDLKLSFYEDRVEASGTLHCRARETMREIALDCDGKKVTYPLDREYEAGEQFTVAVEHVSHPDGKRLEGIYRDVTPGEGRAPARPQQYMSQCQQYGFQRILPIIDDCTAKCTFRTVLEGDARYTHLISNGDLVEGTRLDDGRQRVVYEMRRPMAPYLFLACAGTWEVLADEVEYPDTHRKVKLEYLVPPGHLDGAREPMRILKESVLFQHELTGYEYPFEVYRTICMEKSLYGGMENTGNTTIITEAALIDDTIPDRRLVYAYGVIPHEYEHNHCGSGVTMETVFDMWLNEAYTVNVERAYLARVFGADYMRRGEIASLRGTGGAFAEEEAGMAGAVVREGVNDPDEVVDAITYDKAPEVLNTLRALIGAEAYDAAWREYFRRFAGGNANTDDFLAVFSEVSGRDVRALIGPYLFSVGFPTVHAAWDWMDGRMTVSFTQDMGGSRSCATENPKGVRLSRPSFTIPVTWTAVKDGKDLCGGVFILEPSDASMARTEFSAPFPVKPDFISWNRGGAFYGMLVPSATEEQLACQARTDPDGGNRVEAMGLLRDKNCVDIWLTLYQEIFADQSLDLGLKSELLAIPADSIDRHRRARVRENVQEMRALRRAAALKIGVAELASAVAQERDPPFDAAGGTRSCASNIVAAIKRRACEKCILQLLAAANVPESWAAIRAYLARATNITARLNALRALVASDDPERKETLEKAGVDLRKSLNGYISYLGLVASDPHADVFDAIAREEKREGWSITHPGLSRALYCGFAANGDQLWTPRGLAWLEATLVTYAEVSEYNAIRLLSPVAVWRRFEPGLRAEVKGLLERVAAKLPRDRYAFIGGKLAGLLA